MALYLVTAPAAEPISTAEAKLHLRVDVSADDALIDTLVGAARQSCESATCRRFITQTWDLHLHDFPLSNGPIVLPSPPVSSVTSITYTDTNGDATVLSSSLYTTDLPAGPQARHGMIYPAYQQSWPQVRGIPNAVVVRFVCGYGGTGTSVPPALLAAMKLRLGHLYLHREQVVTGVMAVTVPQAADMLEWQMRAH